MAAGVRVEVGDSPMGASGRGTTQRSAVLATLGSSGRFRTAQEIYSELRQSGARVGLTTVYRHLQKLADSGVIHAVQTASRQTAYRQCSTTAPHHHLICVGCGAGVRSRARTWMIGSSHWLCVSAIRTSVTVSRFGASAQPVPTPHSRCGGSSSRTDRAAQSGRNTEKGER
jgi:hypothetical protein